MSATTTLTVHSVGGAYQVHVGEGALESLGDVVAPLIQGGTVVLLTDSSVGALYAERAASALSHARLRVETLVVDPGERSKTWEQAGTLLELMSERGVGRDDALIALGGGVVGDLGGFCAATYMRGIAVVQVPTTLLAQADSAIGGKTGVDLPRGKNLVGAFWPPVAVVSDTACLSTLPESEWRSGMAEVVKSAILDGEEAVAGLERDAAGLLEREGASVQRAVLMAAGLKVRVVSADERESDGREALNYGHTLGHAIERVAGYGVVPHGVAVAEGMRFAARVAERVIDTDPSWSVRQDALLSAVGLQRTGCEWPPGELLSAMRADKKVRRGEIRFVLSRAPGHWVGTKVADEALKDELSAWCAEDGTEARRS